MTHVSLFTGIGGLDLAAKWAGFNTILQVERDLYCLRVLEKHWPNTRRITDVRQVTRESVEGKVTLLSGGFPCQPFSAAGKRAGTSDDRYLWPEMLRVVIGLSPTYIVAENVSGLLSIDGGLVFETMCSDLERAGYEVLPFHYPAASVGAPHRRDRVFIVAHAGSQRRQQNSGSSSRYEGANGWKSYSHYKPSGHGEACRAEHWQSEPDVGRVAHGVPHRVDRLRALGNAVVPQQAYPIFATIAKLEESRCSKDSK